MKIFSTINEKDDKGCLPLQEEDAELGVKVRDVTPWHPLEDVVTQL